MSVRDPAVAGTFYPARAADVERALGALVEEVEPRIPAKAIVVPHAGWMYSGRVAGAVYGRVRVPRLAIVLGPNHFGATPDAAVFARGRWRLPGGDVAIAEALAESMLAASDALEEDERAHRREHALEVQLPFLRRRRGDVGFVPIVLARADLAFCEEVGRVMAEAVAAAGEDVLIVCSTDLDHYEPQAVVERKDRLVVDALLALDAPRLARAAREHDVSMCGIAAALATIGAMHRLGGGWAALVAHATSGDVSGDYESVVGYGGLVIS